MTKSPTQKLSVQALLSAFKLTGHRLLKDVTGLVRRAFLGSDASNVPNDLHAEKKRAAQAETHPALPRFAANDPQLIPAGKRSPDAVKVTELVTPLAPRPNAPQQAPIFTASVFTFEGEHYPYQLYIPAAWGAEHLPIVTKMPLIVLLHGCTQNAQEFARGTAMNALAEQQQCMVLYPEQISKSNSARCWNWFEPGHQRFGQGEPGMIAALTQQILATDYSHRSADPSRVYIAGLSAGGSMAAVVSSLYPDLYAALGVHSGLAAGSARGLVSAFGAMRTGAKGHATPALPTIVFHGTADKTVHPDNGEHITDAALSALTVSGLSLVKNSSTVGAASQATERTIYRAANGPSYVEHWLIDEGPHAWSGGDARGSYTAPGGPSASAAMLTFFLQHRKQQSIALI